MFEYEKINRIYWNKFKLYQQMVNKVLLIIKTFYLRYLLFFLFDNITSYWVYSQNTLYTMQINKKIGDKQSWLYNIWFEISRNLYFSSQIFDNTNSIKYITIYNKLLKKKIHSC